MEFFEPDISTGVVDRMAPKHLRRIRIILHVLFFILDVADVIMDWLVFSDVHQMESGLVYGPPSPHVVRGFLAFCIIGTLTFLAELLVIVLIQCIGINLEPFPHIISNPFPDILSALIVWIEDIPQVIISFTVVLCRPDAISGFQIAKAIVVIIGGVIRLGDVIHRYRMKLKERRTGIVGGILLAGMAIELIFSGFIFGLNYTKRNSEGGVVFRVPTTISDETYDSSVYFDNVSLFIHHADLFNVEDMNIKDTNPKWLRLFSITNLKENDGGLKFNIEHKDSSEGVANLAIWVRKGGNHDNLQSQWEVSGCYTINQTSTEITVHPNFTCTKSSFFVGEPRRLFMSYRFEKPNPHPLHKRRLIGEIFFNTRNQIHEACSVAERVNPFSLHYFQVSATVDAKSSRHLLDEMSVSPRFFRNVDSDMKDVKSVWKTGWRECATTGSTSPVLDTGMKVACEKMPLIRGDL